MTKSSAESKCFVLDTYALMTVIHEEPVHTIVNSFFEKAKNDKVTLLMNEINVGEVYYRVWKDGNKQAADEALAYIAELPIHFISIDRSFILAAAAWKAQYTISYADAFVVETAVRNKCSIVTGDPEFDAVGEVQTIRLGNR